jgi:hypothetical protein
VTASLLSSHRGDGIFNPKPIPDLAGDPAQRIVSRDPAKPDLERFIHGLITQEFDGPEPPTRVLSGIVTYVRSIAAANCGSADMPLTVDRLLGDVDKALELARSEHDPATARLLIGAARSNLGRINERFQMPGLEQDRAILVEANGELRLLQDVAPRDRPRWERWDRNWPSQKKQLESDAPRSLFSPELLRSASRG